MLKVGAPQFRFRIMSWDNEKDTVKISTNKIENKWLKYDLYLDVEAGKWFLKAKWINHVSSMFIYILKVA